MTDAGEAPTPRIIFLGFSERSSVTEMAGLTRINVIGLSHVVASTIFPVVAAGGALVFAIQPDAFGENLLFELVGPDGDVAWKGTLTLGSEPSESPPPAAPSTFDSGSTWTQRFLVPAEPNAWLPVLLPMPTSETLAKVPGEYELVLCAGTARTRLGSIVFAYLPIPPLDDERRRAIRSNPMAAKSVRLVLGCKECKSELRIYCGIERSSKEEEAGCVWYHDLPDAFACPCGKTRQPLQYLRAGLHGMLGMRLPASGPLSTTRLYESNALHDLIERFAYLLQTERDEEPIQQFVESNLLALAPFTPERVFFKRPILSRHVTDLAVLNQRRELVLIELERPSANLFRSSDDAIAAPLEHALGQLDDWLLQADRNLLGVLDAFDLSLNDVASVSGLVIAGRDRQCSDRQLLKLRWSSWPRKRVWTYDDWLRALGSLAQQLSHA